MRPNEFREIPELKNATRFSQFLKSIFEVFKITSSPAKFKEKAEELGINSRVSFHQIISGKRTFPTTKIPNLIKACDLSFTEAKAANSLLRNTRLNSSPSQNTYALGAPEVLSSPLNTIVLNLCGIQNDVTEKVLLIILAPLFSAEEIASSVKLLLEQHFLNLNEKSVLKRQEISYQLSTPNGIKLEYAKNYIGESLILAQKAYDFPLSDREYTAFTARIKKEDFLKVKDLVRGFRKAVYELSSVSEYDSVAQFNLNAFILSTPAHSEKITNEQDLHEQIDRI